MSEPTASDLAADVRASFEKLRLAGRTSDILKVWCDDGVEALDALVAQVDTLTRERDEAAEVAAMLRKTEQVELRRQRERAEAAEAALADTRREIDKAWIGSQIALCEEFIRAAKNDETFGVEDIEAKLILLTQAER